MLCFVVYYLIYCCLQFRVVLFVTSYNICIPSCITMFALYCTGCIISFSHAVLYLLPVTMFYIHCCLYSLVYCCVYYLIQYFLLRFIHLVLFVFLHFMLFALSHTMLFVFSLYTVLRLLLCVINKICFSKGVTTVYT